MRTDVCNVCDYLRVKKINNCTGLEKGKKVQKILALHQEDANREYGTRIRFNKLYNILLCQR